MIHSMTGFGEASAGSNGIGFSLELRSLNNKFFKLSCRLPEEISALEAELEQALRKGVARGSFVLTMKLRIDDERAASGVNENVLLSYMDHLETVRNKVHDQAVQIDLTQLLALPGVLQPAVDEEKIIEEARPVVLDLLQQALAKLKQMRIVEGVALADDLSKQLDVIMDRLSVIKERAPLVIDEYHDKLSKRVQELLAKAELKVSEPDLLKRRMSPPAERWTSSLRRCCVSPTPSAASAMMPRSAGVLSSLRARSTASRSRYRTWSRA
jgi:uncharacterized protein (TIGR00255 family)